MVSPSNRNLIQGVVKQCNKELREVAPENEPNMNHMLRWGRPICAKLGPGIDLGPKICLATFFSKNFGGKFEFWAIFH